MASQFESSYNNDKYWVRVLHTLSQYRPSFPSVRLVDFCMSLNENDVKVALPLQYHRKKTFGLTLNGISNSSTGHHEIENL